MSLSPAWEATNSSLSSPEIQFPENAAQVAQRVADALAMPIAVDGNEITVSASVGIAVFPADGEDAETLLKNADAAMYHAKSEGRNGYAFIPSRCTTRHSNGSRSRRAFAKRSSARSSALPATQA